MKSILVTGLTASMLMFAGTAVAKPLCTVVADAMSGKILKQEGVCDQRISPASTFKIALSLMGFDAGFLTNTALPAMPFHEHYAAWFPSWKETTTPASWMKNSVVWYSQQMTEWLGKERFQNYIDGFLYGNQDLSGDPGKGNGLTRAWLSSSLKISPLEQSAFLQKLVKRQLPVSTHAYDMTEQLTALGTLPNGWNVNGKTGTGYLLKADGSRNEDRQFGWFIGWARKGERTLTFVHVIQDERKETASAGIRAKEALMPQLPEMLDNL